MIACENVLRHIRRSCRAFTSSEQPAPPPAAPLLHKVGYTPLHRAAAKGHHEVVQLLLLSGASTSSKSSGGFTPLHEAARNGSLACVNLLIAAGADVNARHTVRTYAAMYASTGNSSHLCQRTGHCPYHDNPRLKRTSRTRDSSAALPSTAPRHVGGRNASKRSFGQAPTPWPRQTCAFKCAAPSRVAHSHCDLSPATHSDRATCSAPPLCVAGGADGAGHRPQRRSPRAAPRCPRGAATGASSRALRPTYL